MANPIKFKLEPVDPKQELEKRLNSAPRQHAEALLIVYDIIQSAHDNGTLDLINGLIGGRDMIAGELAKAAKLPGGVAMIRNLMALSKMLMVFSPDALDEFTKHMVTSTGQYQGKTEPDSLLTLGARLISKDTRRALSFGTALLEAFGKSLEATPETAHHQHKPHTQDSAHHLQLTHIPTPSPKGLLIALAITAGVGAFVATRKT